MELVGLDFSHLDTCVGGFQYLLVINLPGKPKSTQPVTKKLKLQLRNYLTTTYCDSEWQGKSTMNKVVSLRTGYSNSCLNHATSEDFAPHQQVKWMNQLIISLLKTLESTERRSCRNHVTKVVHVYYCTTDLSTGYASNFLLFG